MNPSLNSYRFFAFFLVFLFHTGYVSFGYLGVQAFFVLSGFLITPILLKTKENSPTLFLYLKNFLTRRFLRIFPLYYAYLLIIALTILFFGLDQYEYFASLKKQLTYAFTYTYNFYHQTNFCEHNKFLTHFWSLAVEEQFYLFWPFLVYFVNRKSLKRILVLICIFNPLTRLCTGYIVDENIFHVIHDNKYLVVYLSTLSHIDAFAIGGLVGILPKLEIKNHYILTITFLIILIGLGINVFIEHNLNIRSFGYAPFMNGSYRYIWGYSLLNLCFALILIGLRKRTFLPKVFENKIFASLGLISYGLYVYHYGITWIVNHLQNNGFIYDSNILNLFISLSLTIIISYTSFYLFETKFIDMKDKIAPKTFANKKLTLLKHAFNQKNSYQTN